MNGYIALQRIMQPSFKNGTTAQTWAMGFMGVIYSPAFLPHQRHATHLLRDSLLTLLAVYSFQHYTIPCVLSPEFDPFLSWSCASYTEMNMLAFFILLWNVQGERLCTHMEHDNNWTYLHAFLKGLRRMDHSNSGRTWKTHPCNISKGEFCFASLPISCAQEPFFWALMRTQQMKMATRALRKNLRAVKLWIVL